MLADAAGKDPFVQLAALLHNVPESQVGELACQMSPKVLTSKAGPMCVGCRHLLLAGWLAGWLDGWMDAPAK
jgi:hypothetical protein